MENESLDIQKNNEISKEPKKKGNKGLIVFLVLVILAMGGFIAYDKVLKDKYFGKDSDKLSEVIEEDNTGEDLDKIEVNDNKIVNGKIDENNNTKTIIVNSKEHEIEYDYDDGSQTERGLLIYDKMFVAEYYGDKRPSGFEYFIFKASDNREYILIKFPAIVGNYAYLVNENGEIIKELFPYVESKNDGISCFAYFKNDRDTITIENGSVYYYKYDSLESKENYTAKMNKIKLDINNDLISESKTGEQEVMQLGQCSE